MHEKINNYRLLDRLKVQSLTTDYFTVKGLEIILSNIGKQNIFIY